VTVWEELAAVYIKYEVISLVEGLCHQFHISDALERDRLQGVVESVVETDETVTATTAYLLDAFDEYEVEAQLDFIESRIGQSIMQKLPQLCGSMMPLMGGHIQEAVARFLKSEI